MIYGNRFMVSCAAGGAVAVLNPPWTRMTPEEALILAAWLVSIAEHQSPVSFAEVLREVQS